MADTAMTTSPTHDVAATVARAKIKSSMLRMGEPVAFGSDADVIDDLIATIESQAKTLSGAKARHQHLFDKYQAALKAGATSPPTSEGIAAAICETNYKYFGDYELSESQWGAVHCLVNTAHHYLAARDKIEALQGMLSDMEALKNTYRDDCLIAEARLAEAMKVIEPFSSLAKYFDHYTDTTRENHSVMCNARLGEIRAFLNAQEPS